MSQDALDARTAIIFVPTKLAGAQRGSENAASKLLLGWCWYGDPDSETVFVLIADALTSSQASKCSLGSTTNVLGREQACIVGCLHGGEIRKQQDVWLVLKHNGARSKSVPSIAVDALQVKDRISLWTLTLVYYDTPKPDKMRYLALEPMILPLASPSMNVEDCDGSASVAERRARLEHLILLDPVRYADLMGVYPDGRAPGQAFRRAIDLINTIFYIVEGLGAMPSSEARRSAPAPSKATYVCQQIAKSFRSILHITFQGVSLSTVSASANQLSLRLGQLVVWPTLGQQIRLMRLQDKEPICNIASRYTALYNGVWLVANDLIVGQAVGAWVCDNKTAIRVTLRDHAKPLLVSSTIDGLQWLDNWPLGVKLNTPLSHFLSEMFVGMTHTWSEYAFGRSNEDIVESLVCAIGILTRLFGVSMLLCLLIDAVRLFTIHLHVFYAVQQTLFRFFCSSLMSLFHFFRGRKRNPLRKMRVDQATYDLDQLLLGTLFFTVLSFLWLTVATYYAFFACIRFGVCTVIAGLQAALATINHLPLFALMLRLKDPARLPGGVSMDIDGKTTSLSMQATDSLPCTYARLRNTPLSFFEIFRGHHRHLKGIRALPRMAWNVIIGERI